jgi:predicted DNA-binding antitoxin AbrB/MazE fold protein
VSEEVTALAKTFKARYHNGLIEPLEPLSLDDGKEITVTVTELPASDNAGKSPAKRTKRVLEGPVNGKMRRRKVYVSKCVIRLGGIWKDIPFDVSHEDIRQVRRKLSKSLQRRTKRV